MIQSIREEFNEAFMERIKVGIIAPKALALWAAKWMAERCAKFVDSPEFYVKPRDKRADEIRQLTKDLSNE